MSLTLTLTGKTSILIVNYFPAIDLNDGNYEIGLCLFETYNTIPNIDSTNNKFYFDNNNEEIVIPEGTYELNALQKFLQNAILHKRQNKEMILLNDNDDDDDENIIGKKSIIVRANENTMRCTYITLCISYQFQ